MINHTTFFQLYRTTFGKLNESQVAGLDYLLGRFEREPRWADIRCVSYALATIKHETAHTFQPIEERGGKVYLSRYYLKPSLRKTLGNTELADSWKFKGRGYVQITGRRNYTLFEDLIAIHLVAAPDLALVPEHAFRIMTVGMFEGRFTGRRLGQFITPLVTDYFNARRIINGLDKAQEIADSANKFEAILRSSEQPPHLP